MNTLANGGVGIGGARGVCGHSGGLNGAGGDAYYCTGSNHECCNGNDVVLIKVGLVSVPARAQSEWCLSALVLEL